MYLTIDPGLSGTGWALWNPDWTLGDNGVISTSKSNKEVFRKLSLTFNLHFIKKAFIENPAKFSGVKGDMVASSGKLVKLAELVGYLEGGLHGYDIEVVLVSVNEWKGQMPKEAVIRRIKRILPDVKAKSHDWDAIGIGLYLKGDF